MEYNNVFGTKEKDDGNIPEPDKKAHAIHRKPGPPIDEQYDDDEDHVGHRQPAKVTQPKQVKLRHQFLFPGLNLNALPKGTCLCG